MTKTNATYYGEKIRLVDENEADVIGEVTASPGATTVLGRLKALTSDIVLKAGTALIGKVGIDQTTPGTTDRVTANVDKVGGTAQTARDWSTDFSKLDISLSKVNPFPEIIEHPFGKSTVLTTDGQQYGAAVQTTDDDYKEVESITFTNPTGLTLKELDVALVGAIISSGATEAVNWKWQISDAGVTWVDLIAEQTKAASAAAYSDTAAVMGRFLPVANALLTGATFKIRFVVKSAGAGGETASGKTKNSSYVRRVYG